jgi:hypothetical protein
MGPGLGIDCLLGAALVTVERMFATWSFEMKARRFLRLAGAGPYQRQWRTPQPSTQQRPG